MTGPIARFGAGVAAVVVALSLTLASVTPAAAEDDFAGAGSKVVQRQDPPLASPAPPDRASSPAAPGQGRRVVGQPVRHGLRDHAAGRAASRTAAAEAPAIGVSGRVVGTDEVALAGAEIEVYADAGDYWDFSTSVISDETGGYQVALKPGTYAVRFVAPAGLGLANQWWQDKPASGWAKPIVVTNGLTSGVDAQLRQGGEISGTVNNIGDSGYEGVDVQAYLRGDDGLYYVDSAETDVLGRYLLAGLPAGEKYTLLFEPPITSTHVEQWWQKAATVDDATFFPLNPGDALVRDAKLVTVGGMQGRVTGLGGAPVPGVWADAYLSPDGVKLSYVDSARTDDEGYFRITGLAPGWYYLYFDTSEVPGYVSKWREHESGGIAYIKIENYVFPNLNDRLQAVLKTAKPAVLGLLAVGGRVTANPGTWTAGTSFSYQWYADGKAISTAASPKLVKAQLGKKITVRVTGRKAGYATAAVTSAATGKVALAATPKISGKAKVGSTLKAKPGTWTSKTKFSYRWYANGKPIAKATKSKLRLGKSLKGKKLTVVVTGRKSGYATVSKTSSATKAVR